MCSSSSMQSLHNHCTLHLGHVWEHSPQTGRLHGPLGLCAFPGHLFSAIVGQLGPGAQHPTRMEIVLVLRDERTLPRDPDLAPDLGILARPRSDLEPLLSTVDCLCPASAAVGGADGCAAASSRSSRSTRAWNEGRSGTTLSEFSGMDGCQAAVPMAGLKNPVLRGLGFSSSISVRTFF